MDRQLGQRCPPSLLEGRRQAQRVLGSHSVQGLGYWSGQDSDVVPRPLCTRTARNSRGEERGGRELFRSNSKAVVRFGTVVSCLICLSSSFDEHHCTHSCLGTGLRCETFSIFVVLVHLWFTCLCVSVSVGVWMLGTGHSTTILFILCKVLETGDRQLVSEPGVGRNHGNAMGKNWRGYGSVLTSTMEARPSTVAGDIIVAEELAGEMAFETAQRRKPDCDRGRHGRCIDTG